LLGDSESLSTAPLQSLYETLSKHQSSLLMAAPWFVTDGELMPRPDLAGTGGRKQRDAGTSELAA
jgi:hypothetical protein